MGTKDRADQSDDVYFGRHPAGGPSSCNCWLVTGLTLLLYVVSPRSKESEDRTKAM